MWMNEEGEKIEEGVVQIGRGKVWKYKKPWRQNYFIQYTITVCRIY